MEHHYIFKFNHFLAALLVLNLAGTPAAASVDETSTEESTLTTELKDGEAGPVMASDMEADPGEKSITSSTVQGTGTLDQTESLKLDSTKLSAFDKAFLAGFAVTQEGPQSIPFGGSAAKVDVPADYGLIPETESKRILAALGERETEHVVGLLHPADQLSNWFVTVSYHPVGHVDEKGLADIDAGIFLEKLKKIIKEDSQTGNGMIAGVEITGWEEVPAYNAENHSLVWSYRIRYTTHSGYSYDNIHRDRLVFGRVGIIRTSALVEDGVVPEVQALMSAVTFASGQRYDDFNERTDKLGEIDVLDFMLKKH